MRKLLGIASATLLVTACGGDTAATNAANESDANLALDAHANDASAMESVANMTEEAPPTENLGNAAEDPLGETSGGDTGGNVMDNIAGM
jgi:hypothetical protein